MICFENRDGEIRVQDSIHRTMVIIELDEDDAYDRFIYLTYSDYHERWDERMAIYIDTDAFATFFTALTRVLANQYENKQHVMKLFEQAAQIRECDVADAILQAQEVDEIPLR